MFWEIFSALCLEKNISANAVCSKLGFSSATATHWKKGSVPNGDALSKIADYFDVSIDYLLGRTDVPEVNKGTAHAKADTYVIEGAPYIAAKDGEKIKGKVSLTAEDLIKIAEILKNNE